MQISEHAAQRLQQRGITQSALKLLRRYGGKAYSKGGCIRFFDRRSRRQLMNALGSHVEEPERLSGLYLIESQEGVIVTAGHRYRRIKRDYQPGRRQARRRSHRFQSVSATR